MPRSTSQPLPKDNKLWFFAGGCFWGVEAVFEHLNGVSEVVSGFSGGSATTAHYHEVSYGRTGHAEAVSITYDPSKISYGQLLKVYFSVAHDPTQLNRQGPDSGTQYRSAIFFANPEQQQVAPSLHQPAHSSPQLQPADRHAARAPRWVSTRLKTITRTLSVATPTIPTLSSMTCPSCGQLQKQFPDLYKS